MSILGEPTVQNADLRGRANIDGEDILVFGGLALGAAALVALVFGAAFGFDVLLGRDHAPLD